MGFNYWKNRVLSLPDGSGTIRGKEAGIIVVTTLDLWIFDLSEADHLADAARTLSLLRKSPVAVVIDRQKEMRGRAWKTLTSDSLYKEDEIPDVLVGYDAAGNQDIAPWVC